MKLAAIARSLVIGHALAACGGDEIAPVDAGPPEPPVEPACAAVFSQNFAETWTGPANCAGVDPSGDHTTLQLAIPSRTLGVPFAISIDLGEAPTPGTYTAQNLVTPWSASALHEFDMTSCLYHAGTAAVPPGSFTLVLDAIDPTVGPPRPAGSAVGIPTARGSAAPIDAHAHGKLDVVLYVLARPYTYCGETNTEHLAVTF